MKPITDKKYQALQDQYDTLQNKVTKGDICLVTQVNDYRVCANNLTKHNEAESFY